MSGVGVLLLFLEMFNLSKISMRDNNTCNGFKNDLNVRSKSFILLSTFNEEISNSLISLRDMKSVNC